METMTKTLDSIIAFVEDRKRTEHADQTPIVRRYVHGSGFEVEFVDDRSATEATVILLEGQVMLNMRSGRMAIALDDARRAVSLIDHAVRIAEAIKEYAYA